MREIGRRGRWENCAWDAIYERQITKKKNYAFTELNYPKPAWCE